MALSVGASTASGFRLAYATTLPFGRGFGAFEKLEILFANRSLVLMFVTPFAVRTLCRCSIVALGLRYTRPAAVDRTGAAIWAIGGIVVFFVSRTVWAWLNVLLPGVFGWSSSSLVSCGSLRLSTGFVFVKFPSWLRASICRM